jgi:hypothetical protein
MKTQQGKVAVDISPLLHHDSMHGLMLNLQEFLVHPIALKPKSLLSHKATALHVNVQETLRHLNFLKIVPSYSMLILDSSRLGSH